MDNNELALALRESHLEKIASYLSRCGTTRNEQLCLQGYHDIGWDPVDGERFVGLIGIRRTLITRVDCRFLDFLKFCVWVNGKRMGGSWGMCVRV